uniref:HAT C-terminal dimerisation domain-containing protein n=1 Tax=Lactuca sativa TaxID=4236 RepID=A0A9R1WSQ4_LACSA|nr:hypothetical protein LSAT_V11C900500640 [Lactuca sativa]
MYYMSWLTELNLKTNSEQADDEVHIDNVKHNNCKRCNMLLKTNSSKNDTSKLPFKFVENESFIEYTKELNGESMLMKFFSNPLSNVHLITKFWTRSCQGLIYVVVMTLFIDEDWAMHIRSKLCDEHKHIMEWATKFDKNDSSQSQTHAREDTKYILYTIVSCMEKDILGLQISTMALETGFGISGRILDPYRTKLSTIIIEALVCTQYWVRKSRKPIVDYIDEILKDDEVAKALEEAINNGIGKGKQPINIPE